MTPMDTDTESFSRIALAEKELCELAGPKLGAIIAYVAKRHGVEISEVRVTLSKPDRDAPWAGANCVIVA